MNEFHSIHPRKLDRHQVEEFLASLSQEYAQSSINQAVLAINCYYQCEGIDYHFKTKSLRTNQKLPQAILSRKEVKAVESALPFYYQKVLNEIYQNLTPPKDAVEKFSSRGYSDNHLHINTLSQHIKKARQKIGLNKLATPKTIHQSGIIHYLQDTNDLREAANKSSLSDKRILYYYKIAQLFK